MTRHLHFALLAPALSALALAAPARAQTPPAATQTAPREKIGVASVSFADKCPHAAVRTERAGDKVAGAFLPILSDFVGNLVGGGLTILSDALADAARASAIGGEGRANFDYYLVDSDSGKRTVRIGTGDMSCLIVVINKLPKTVMTAGATAEPVLTLEAYLRPLASGFVVEPVYIAYDSDPLPGGSRKRLAAELDITLAGPLAFSNGAASESVFAVARIKLPNLMPGDIWQGSSLTVRSGILPHRAPDTIVETDARVAAIQGVRSATKAEDVAFRKIASLLGLIGVPGDWKCGEFAYACIKIAGSGPVLSVSKLAEVALKADSGYPETLRTEIGTAIVAHRTAQHDLAVARATLDAIAKSYGTMAVNGTVTPDGASKATTGSTSLTARLFIMTNEKKFLKLLSGALGTAATAVKPAVSGAIQGDPAWTTADSTYALAMAKVREEELALATALAAPVPDQVAIEKARTAVLRAKATANENAVTAKRPIPFPGLLP